MYSTYFNMFNFFLLQFFECDNLLSVQAQDGQVKVWGSAVSQSKLFERLTSADHTTNDISRS